MRFPLKLLYLFDFHFSKQKPEMDNVNVWLKSKSVNVVQYTTLTFLALCVVFTISGKFNM